VIGDQPGVPQEAISRGAPHYETTVSWPYGRHSFDTGADPSGQDRNNDSAVVNNDPITRRA
jgi:hypothetical protein